MGQTGLVSDDGGGLAAATRATYECGLTQWRDWADGAGVAVLPASVEGLAGWVAALAAAGRRRSSVRVRLAAVGWAHRRAGLVDATQAAAVRSALAAVDDDGGGRLPVRFAARLAAVDDAALAAALRRRRRRGRGYESDETLRRRVRRDLLAVGLVRSLRLTANEVAALRWCDLDLWRGAHRMAWLRLVGSDAVVLDAFGVKLGAECPAWLFDLVTQLRSQAADERELVLGVTGSQAARRLRRLADEAASWAAWARSLGWG